MKYYCLKKGGIDKQIDELEIVTEEISRLDSSSKKQTQVYNFTREAKRQVDDLRDVVLIAVAIK